MECSRFKHENDKERSANLRKENDEGMDLRNVEEGKEPAWVPLGLKVKMDAEGKLHVHDCTDDAVIDTKEGYSYYEIMASVSCIRDNNSTSGGHVVSCPA